MGIVNDPHRPAAPFAKVLASPASFLLLLAGYFALHCVIRLWISPTTDLDESEQLLATQKLAWGYGSQPPLYTWLQFPLVKLLGPTVLPLTLLKNALLFCLFAATYFNARLLVRQHWLAVLAGASLFFVPQLSWEAQRDLTHTVLVTLFTALTFLSFLQLRLHPAARWYLAFGLCAALGTLSKYSYVIFLVGLVVAGLLEPNWRGVLINRRIWLALGAGGLVLLPHLIWLTQNQKTALTAVGSFHLAKSIPWLSVVGVGLKSLLIAAVPHSLLLLFFYAMVCARQPASAAPEIPDAGVGRVILRALVVMFGLVLAGIFLFRATEFKGRWFTPLLVWLPVLLVVKLQPRLTGRRVTVLLALATVGMLAVLAAIPGRVRLAGALNRPRELNVVFEKLAAGMTDIERPKLIYAQNNWLGGNLKRCFPDAFVFSPILFLQTKLPAGTNCLVVWDATGTNSPSLKIAEAMFASVQAAPGDLKPHYTEAPLTFIRNQQTRLGYAWVRPKVE